MKNLTTIVSKWSVCGEDSRDKLNDIAIIIGEAKSLVRSVELKKMTKEDAYEALTELLGVDR